MKRSKFSLSHQRLLSFSQGELIPIGLTEVLPGDTVQMSTKAFLRVSPLVTPVMHRCHARIEHFFVPHRLVWDSWEDFITGGEDGDDDSEHPYMRFSASSTNAVGSLFDYYGVPTGTFASEMRVSALPVRGYNLIFNEWYRDQDLVNKLVVATTDGLDSTTTATLQMRAWGKDHLTTARPWEQKGPAVTLPLGTTAPVVSAGTGIPKFNLPQGVQNLRAAAGTAQAYWTGGNPGVDGNASWNDPELEADLSSATAVDVNDVRRAFAIQRMLEARARFGSRYTEYLAYLGVSSPDARLQRPEYLGGGRNALQFSEVLQTAEGTNPVGTLKGHGVGAMRSNRFRRHFTEHGYIHSFISVLPEAVYMQALPRTWRKFTKDDYFQKELQHIGQQEVKNHEVNALAANPDAIWGYQDRYDEYRYPTGNGVSGEFRTTLNSWHMARDFTTTLPALNSSFVQSNPTNRVYASTATDQIYCMAENKIVARRIVSREGNSFIF